MKALKLQKGEEWTKEEEGTLLAPGTFTFTQNLADNAKTVIL